MKMFTANAHVRRKNTLIGIVFFGILGALIGIPLFCRLSKCCHKAELFAACPLLGQGTGAARR